MPIERIVYEAVLSAYSDNPSEEVTMLRPFGRSDSLVSGPQSFGNHNQQSGFYQHAPQQPLFSYGNYHYQQHNLGNQAPQPQGLSFSSNNHQFQPYSGGHAPQQQVMGWIPPPLAPNDATQQPVVHATAPLPQPGLPPQQVSPPQRVRRLLRCPLHSRYGVQICKDPGHETTESLILHLDTVHTVPRCAHCGWMFMDWASLHTHVAEPHQSLPRAAWPKSSVHELDPVLKTKMSWKRYLEDPSSLRGRANNSKLRDWISAVETKFFREAPTDEEKEELKKWWLIYVGIFATNGTVPKHVFYEERAPAVMEGMQRSQSASQQPGHPSPEAINPDMAAGIAQRQTATQAPLQLSPRDIEASLVAARANNVFAPVFPPLGIPKGQDLRGCLVTLGTREPLGGYRCSYMEAWTPDLYRVPNSPPFCIEVFNTAAEMEVHYAMVHHPFEHIPDCERFFSNCGWQNCEVEMGHVGCVQQHIVGIVPWIVMQWKNPAGVPNMMGNGGGNMLGNGNGEMVPNMMGNGGGNMAVNENGEMVQYPVA